MIRHVPGLDRDRWYVIDVDRSDEGSGAPAWRSRLIALEGPRSRASVEWALFGRGFGVGVEVGRNGDESDLGLSVYLGRVGSVWMRLRAPWTAWARVSKERAPDRWYNPRESGLRFFPYDGCIVCLSIDRDMHHWSRSDAWWHEIKLATGQFLGRTHVETVEGASGMTRVPLPEGNYEAFWREQVATHRYVGWRLGRVRDLLVGPRTIRYVELRIEGGIPVEGKGENSWDCGMDGLFGCGGRTLEDAVGAAVSHVLRDRRRYGGPHDLERPMTVAEAAGPRG